MLLLSSIVDWKLSFNVNLNPSKMMKFERQYNLFNKNDTDFLEPNNLQDININEKVIREWQNKIILHQSPFFRNVYKNVNQPSLFKSNSEESVILTFTIFPTAKGNEDVSLIITFP